MKKIGIITNRYVLKENPTLYYLSKGLSDSGYHVSVFTSNDSDAGDSTYDDISVKIISDKNYEYLQRYFLANYIKYRHVRSAVKFLLKKFIHEDAFTVLILKIYRKFLRNYGKFIISFTPEFLLKRIVSFSDYACVSSRIYASFLKKIEFRDFNLLMVVEPEGLMAYHFAAIKTPFVYLSLELNNLSFEKILPGEKFKKMIEMQYIPKAEFAIIQDETREKFFRNDNQLDAGYKILYLPVSFPGEINLGKTRYFQEKFNISDDKRIVLYAGGIMPWACLCEIAETVNTWDDKFVFVIHGSRIDSSYLEKLKIISEKSDRIFISTDWIEYEKFHEIISSAHIGISCYSDNTLNNRLTLYASGKTAAYFKSGLPVILKDFENIKSFCDKNQCGMTIAGYDEIKDVLVKLDMNYENYRRSAHSAFKRFYSFESHFNKILKNIHDAEKVHEKSEADLSDNIDIGKINHNLINGSFSRAAVTHSKILVRILNSAYHAENELGYFGHALPHAVEHLKTGRYVTMLKRYISAGELFCNDKTVLDSCCGLGWGACILSDYAKNVYAFDADNYAIKFSENLWKRKNIKWFIADALNVSSVLKQEFDVITAMETIEHYSKDDGEQYMRELSKLLKPGGYLVGTSSFPQKTEQAERLRLCKPEHKHIFTYEEISILLKKYFRNYTVIGNWMFIAEK